MTRPRFQFKMWGMLLAVALLSGPMLLLRPSSKGEAPVIEVFGPALVRQDGSIEVQGGEVRISQGAKRTELRADRILVKKDGTAEVYGSGAIVQTAR